MREDVDYADEWSPDAPEMSVRTTSESRLVEAEVPHGRSDAAWLTNTTNAMLRCGTVASLLDLAYDAIRSGLGFDRVGLSLFDRSHRLLIERIGTDEHGEKIYPVGREFPVGGMDYALTLLNDPCMRVDGKGYILQRNVQELLSAEQRKTLDGQPDEVLRISLRTSDAVAGLISVDNLISQRPITESQILPLVTFANMLAVALENVALLEERSQRIESLHADLLQREANLAWLLEIGGRVNSASTLDEVLDAVYDAIREGLGYDRIGIVLFDWKRETFEEVRGTDEYGNKTSPDDRVLPLTPESSIWMTPDMKALSEGKKFFYTDDVYRDTPPDQRYLLDGRPTHNLAVALRSGGVMTGLISVDNFTSGRPIELEQSSPLLALANQLGTAVERARVLESERAERSRLQVLLESARALNSTLDSDRILEVLASSLQSALNASAVDFSHVDRDTRQLLPIADRESSSRKHGEASRSRDIPNRYELIEQVLDGRRPYVGHVDFEGDVTSVAAADREGSTVLFVPLVVHSQTIGVLEVYWKGTIQVSDETIDLCTAIGDQAGLAIRNARLYAEATRQAECDPVTGLFNHRSLLNYLDAMLGSSMPFALLLIDVDDFKLFNDTHGHLVGDAILVQVAAILRSVCREGDRAARHGGDEFAVVLAGAGRSEAQAVALRLQHAVRARPFMSAESRSVPISVSVGIACYSEDGRTYQELVAVADANMYSSKRGEIDTPAFGSTIESRRGTGWLKRGAADLLGDSPFGVLEGLVDAVDAKDRYTREHSNDVTRLALLVADQLQLDEEQRRQLILAGTLHDVGKIAIPDRILRKPGRLTAQEYEAVTRHVAYGVALIRGVMEDPGVVDAVAVHHERWDGAGYPNGVPGSRTPLIGRIMQIADAASAMLLDRPYRRGLSCVDVVAELRVGANTQFDPMLVEPFVRVLEGGMRHEESA